MSTMPESVQADPKLKVVISNLPADLTVEEFKSIVETYISRDNVDWVFYRQGKPAKRRSRFAGSDLSSQQTDSRQIAFRRSYAVLHFKSVEALVAFNRFCNGKEIQAGVQAENGKESNSTGKSGINEVTKARVTFAFFQKTPLDFADQTDLLEGTIDKDEDYRKFVASETGQPYEPVGGDEDPTAVDQDPTITTLSDAAVIASPEKPQRRSRNRNRHEKSKEKRKEKAKGKEKEESASQPRRTKAKEPREGGSKKTKKSDSKATEGKKTLAPKKILTASSRTTDGDLSDLLPVPKPVEASIGQEVDAPLLSTGNGEKSETTSSSKQARAPRQRRRKPQNKDEDPKSKPAGERNGRRERSKGEHKATSATTTTTSDTTNNDGPRSEGSETNQSRTKTSKSDSESKRHRHHRNQTDSEGRRNADKRSGASRQKKDVPTDSNRQVVTLLQQN